MNKHTVLGFTFSISKSKKFRVVPRMELIDPMFYTFVFSWFGYKGWIRKSTKFDRRKKDESLQTPQI